MKRAVLLVVIAGCALTQPSSAIELRYFSPALPPRAAQEPCAKIRLGRIHAAADLGFAIEHRVSEVELQPYETLRWSELPEAYVRRALDGVLFSSRAFDEATADAPVLAVEVVAFEDSTHGTVREGRVELEYTLRDDQRVIARGTASSAHVAAKDSIDAAVTAIGSSLVDATDQIARELQDARCPAVR